MKKKKDIQVPLVIILVVAVLACVGMYSYGQDRGYEDGYDKGATVAHESRDAVEELTERPECAKELVGKLWVGIYGDNKGNWYCVEKLNGHTHSVLIFGAGPICFSGISGDLTNCQYVEPLSPFLWIRISNAK